MHSLWGPLTTLLVWLSVCSGGGGCFCLFVSAFFSCNLENSDKTTKYLTTFTYVFKSTLKYFLNRFFAHNSIQSHLYSSFNSGHCHKADSWKYINVYKYTVYILYNYITFKYVNSYLPYELT